MGRCSLGLLLALMLTGCAMITDLESDLHFSVDVHPAIVAAGGTAEFVVTAYNPTRTVVVIPPVGCGPQFDVNVIAPNGDEELVRQTGYFTCEGRDESEIHPGETDQVTWSWTAPSVPGTYRAYGYTRADCADEPCRTTDMIEFEVR